MSDDGGNSDTLGGGIFLYDAPPKPPKGRLKISTEDRAKVAEYLRNIAGSPEKLEAAAFNPKEAMEKAGLSGRRQIDLPLTTIILAGLKPPSLVHHHAV